MKNKIKFTLLLLIAIPAVMFSCNQSSGKDTIRKDFNREMARLEEIREKIDLNIKNVCDSIDYISERINSLAGDYKNIAVNVKQRADEIVTWIQYLKIEIIEAVEGPGSPAINKREINSANISSLKNTKVPSEILIGKNENGKAFVLKALLKDYKEFLIETSVNDSLIKRSIDNVLNIDDQKNKTTGKNPEKTLTWENNLFKAQPLGSVIITLTRMQNNIQSTQSEVLSLIQNQMEAKLKK
jgi:hypothetical protein